MNNALLFPTRDLWNYPQREDLIFLLGFTLKLSNYVSETLLLFKYSVSDIEHHCGLNAGLIVPEVHE